MRNTCGEINWGPDCSLPAALVHFAHGDKALVLLWDEGECKRQVLGVT